VGDDEAPGRRRHRPALVSVVVPVLDGAATIEVQLAALAGQTYDGPWEVVVADNGSVDGTPDVVRSWADKLPVRVVDASAERGINPARNAGAAAAAGDLVVFCDADDEVDAGWVAAMAAAAEDADVLGGRLDDASLNDDVVATWRPHNAGDDLPVALRFLPFAVGANCGAWRDVIERLGGFDPEYRRGGADVEFFWRAQLAGYRLAFVPDAVVRYRHRSGLRALARQFFRYGMADAQLYRAFRHAGLRRDSAGEVWRAWRLVAVHALKGRDPGRRGEGLRLAAQRAGRLRGSLRQRVMFP
jgi:glycosyltransferase involved in cell wall biosynthesis